MTSLCNFKFLKIEVTKLAPRGKIQSFSLFLALCFAHISPTASLVLLAKKLLKTQIIVLFYFERLLVCGGSEGQTDGRKSRFQQILGETIAFSLH